MKTWIYRTPVSDIPEEDVHMVERHPEIEYDYTKLYVLYDDPNFLPSRNIESCRKAEIPNYWYPEVKPGETVQLNSNIDEDVKKVISFHFGMYRYQVEHFDHNGKKDTSLKNLHPFDHPMKRGTKIYRFIDWPYYKREITTAIEFDSFLEEKDIKKRILADTLRFHLWDPEDYEEHFLKFENDTKARAYYVMKHINKRERVDHGYPECQYPYQKCPVCGGKLHDDILEPKDVEDVFNSYEGSGPDGEWSSWEEIHRCPNCDKLFFIKAEY